jgi:hypothetical protein
VIVTPGVDERSCGGFEASDESTLRLKWSTPSALRPRPKKTRPRSCCGSPEELVASLSATTSWPGYRHDLRAVDVGVRGREPAAHGESVVGQGRRGVRVNGAGLGEVGPCARRQHERGRQYRRGGGTTTHHGEYPP